MDYNEQKTNDCEKEELPEDAGAENLNNPEVNTEEVNADKHSKAEKSKDKGNKKKPDAELEKAQALADDYKRKWYSVSAEYDNYRKRTQSAVSQAYADGKAEAIKKLLPVADTFGYAYDSTSDEKTKAGIDKIVKNFNTILASLGVTEIEVLNGSDFDENVAEAIMNVPCEEGESPNKVKYVLKKGYRQGDKVIRHAQVAVTI